MNALKALLYAFAVLVYTASIGFFIAALARSCDDAEAYEIPNPAIVHTLDTVVKIGTASGSVVEGKSGRHYLLTNWHVCLRAANGLDLIGEFTNREKVIGIIMAKDVGSDLCAARINENTPFLTLAKNQDVRDIMTFGYPDGQLTENHGYTKERFEWSYEIPIENIHICPIDSTINYLSDHSIKSCTFHWTNVLTNLFARLGSSGSPVLDDSGFLVSVITSQDQDHNDYSGGIVPPEKVKAFLDKL